MTDTRHTELHVIVLHQSDVMPSALGRIFATKAACEEYCKREGFTVMARVYGSNSGMFYAPLLRIETEAL